MVNSNTSRNSEGFFDYTKDPTLGDALGNKSPGDEIDLKMCVQVVSNDTNGMSYNVKPGSVEPDGYEREEPPDSTDNSSGGGVETPAPQPPGSLATAPVVTAMRLKKKGE